MFGFKSLVFLLGKSVRGLFASKEKPRGNGQELAGGERKLAVLSILARLSE